jgi:hypothetical protein
MTDRRCGAPTKPTASHPELKVERLSEDPDQRFSRRLVSSTSLAVPCVLVRPSLHFHIISVQHDVMPITVLEEHSVLVNRGG